MSQKNLLSIVRGPWAIDYGYAMDHLPLYLSMLKGNIVVDAAQVEHKIPLSFTDLEGNTVENRSNGSNTGNNQYVAVMALNHPIYKYDQSCGPMGTQSYMRELRYMEQDNDIAGVVLKIDSGGGQADGNAEFAAFLDSYSKPVVVYTNGMLASAAYYMAAGANEIVSSPYAMSIGSIGTMMMSVNPKGMIEKEGGKLHLIYATKSTRKNHAFNELILNDDESPMREEVLDPLQAVFEGDVKRLRPSIDASVFNGDVFSPEQALELGMVDSLGSLQDAVDRVITLSRKRDNNNVNNSNQHTQMETTPRPALQNALGIDAPLAATEEHGSYLNQEQLDTIEQSLQQGATAQTDLEAAQTALQEAQDEITTAATAQETAQEEILAALGVEVEEGSTAQATILSSITALRDSKPAVVHTTTTAATTAENKSGLDMDLEHNQRLNNALKIK